MATQEDRLSPTLTGEEAIERADCINDFCPNRVDPDDEDLQAIVDYQPELEGFCLGCASEQAAP